MKTKLHSCYLAVGLVVSMSSHAAELEITLTNLTHGVYFTPLIIAAHNQDAHLYQLGEPASLALQAMAEGGDIAPLQAELQAQNSNIVMNPAVGLLAPSKSTSAMLMTDSTNQYLSLTAMLLPTNDGFVGLSAWPIPTTAGTYHIYLDGYDAGTEANNELVVAGSGASGMLGIPASPGMEPGSNGTGVTSSESNKTVHVHRGNVGDNDPQGGASDLHNTVHRWLNPVAKLTVVVK
ncbi:spondin domain-containing protein [Pseudoalteromonas fenneropenaei]|uniref:Spondin domain-containing protein n=1 Tax=Pseudoalteromonas fenneropenaei TaxID=1737459 RepID=A0ABV7CI26_9GAMM